jgi:hypothetical protein
MAGNSLDDDASQHRFYLDDGHLDRPDSASPGPSILMLGDVRESQQLCHSPTEIVPQQCTLDSDSLYQRLDPLIVDAHPHSETQHHRIGSIPETLRNAHSVQRSSSSHAHSHDNVLAPQFYDAATLPLKDRTEAVLFRHYIQKLAVCVSDKFGTVEISSMSTIR